MNKLFRYEFVSVALGILGVLLGLYLPEWAISLEFIGKIFILLLKMLIIPLVVTSIFLSLARLRHEEIKSLGGFTISYYLATSAFACTVGLVIANSISFAQGMPPEGTVAYDASKLADISFTSVITSFFAGNFFHALSEGNIIQVVVFTLFVGMASLQLPIGKREALVNLADSFQDVLMIIIHWIIKFAPLGIFSLLAAIVAKTDTQLFQGLGPLFMAISLAVIIHVGITLSGIGYFVGGFNPYAFLFKVKRALVVALTTASSTATLPVSNQELIDHGQVKEKTSGFILPLGATLNMDGSALYQGIVLIFLAEFSGMDLSLSQQLLIFFFVMTSSIGSAGIPGGGLMMFGAVMEMVGIPLEYIGVYLLVDRFWDYPITMVNVLGDLIGAKTIDRWID